MVSMRRVLIISDVTGRGGVDTYIKNLAEYANFKGYEVEIVLEENREPFMFDMVPDIRITYKNIYHGFNADSEIRKYIEAIVNGFTPDIVHVVCGSVKSSLVIRETIIGLQIPLYFTEAYVDENLVLSTEQIEKINSIYSGAEKAIALCENNKRILNERFSNSKDKIEIIPPLLNDLQEVEECWYKEKDYYHFLCIGRLVPQKGFDLLIKALKHLDKDILNKFKIDIWGDGPCENELLREIEKEELRDVVTLKGWCSNSNVMFKQYDLFLFPSRCEGQPYTLILAMLSGIPCISADISGIRELFQGCEDNLFDIKREESLAPLIVQFLSNPLLFWNRAKICKDNVKKKCGTKNLKKIVSLWESRFSDTVS